MLVPLLASGDQPSLPWADAHAGYHQECGVPGAARSGEAKGGEEEQHTKTRGECEEDQAEQEETER